MTALVVVVCVCGSGIACLLALMLMGRKQKGERIGEGREKTEEQSEQ